MERIFTFESATYLSAEDAFRILSELAKLFHLDAWMLSSQTGEQKSRIVTYDIAGISDAYAENCRTHGASRSEMVSFTSQDKQICGTINASMYRQKNWIADARKHGLRLNQLIFGITTDEMLDAKFAAAYQSILECICRNVNLVQASVRSLDRRYPKRKKGALGIASALTGVYWMNFFGNSILEKLDITKLKPEFNVSNIGGGSVVTFCGDEQLLCEAGDEFILRLGEDYFWPVDKTKAGRAGLFSFIGELAMDRIHAGSERIRFELDLNGMIYPAKL